MSASASNIPVLYQNIMFGLLSDFARDVFLWAVERPHEDVQCYRAEAFARQADQLVQTLQPMLTAAAHIHGLESTDPDLLRFILTRHANSYWGGNLAFPYGAAA